MSRLLCLILLCAITLISPLLAVELVTAEYYFDIDPGFGAGTPLTIAASGHPIIGDTTSAFVGEVLTTGLSSGLHRLGIRFQDNLGRWSTTDTRLLFVMTDETPDTSDLIVQAEYSFDSSAGTVVDIADGSDVAVSLAIDIDSLTLGLHRFSMRFQDENDHWSSSDSRLFYKNGISSPTASTIVAAEYAIDYGSSQSISIGAPAESVDIATLIDISVLSDGLHLLSVRVQDEREHWSIADTRLFYVLGLPSPAVATIVAAEYAINYGAWQSIAIGVPGDSVSTFAPIDISALPDGLHRVSLRVQDNHNHWSNADTRLFFVTEDNGNTQVQLLDAGEFFINVDPGPGYGLPLTAVDGAFNDTLENTIDTVNAIPVGQHVVGVRFKDNRGLWSGTAIDTFVVGPLLTVKPSNPPLLNWTSDGASMYYVYRATAFSGPFAVIDSTTSTTYADNENPQNGTNTVRRYYRITQRLDGGLSAFRLPAALPATTRIGKESRQQLEEEHIQKAASGAAK